MDAVKADVLDRASQRTNDDMILCYRLASLIVAIQLPSIPLPDLVVGRYRVQVFSIRRELARYCRQAPQARQRERRVDKTHQLAAGVRGVARAPQADLAVLGGGGKSRIKQATPQLGRDSGVYHPLLHFCSRTMRKCAMELADVG